MPEHLQLRNRFDSSAPGVSAKPSTCPAVALLAALAIASGTQVSVAQFLGSVDALSPTAGADIGNESHFRLATDGAGNWVAVWASDESGDLDIHSSTSGDGGRTWTEPQTISTGVDDDENPEIVYAGQGRWISTWVSNTGNGIIHFAQSTDQGQSWPIQGTLETPAQQGGGMDTDPSIAASDTTAVIVWSSSRNFDGSGPDTDILMSMSVNGGASWSTAVLVNTNHEDDASEDVEPSIATDKAAFWTVVWNMDGQIASARSEDNAATWTDPALLPGAAGSNPQVVSDTSRSLPDDSIFEGFENMDAGYWLATFTAGKDVVVSRYLDTGPDFGGDVPEGEIEDVWREPVAVGTGTDPFLATNILGTWILAWSSEDDPTGDTGPDADIFFARSVNNGVEWEDAVAIDPTATEDAAADTSPAFASDLGDNWIAVWASDDDRDGIGVDTDWLTAPFTFSVDCNTNGIADATDLESGASVDENGTGQPDECDPPAEPEPDPDDPTMDDPDDMQPDDMGPGERPDDMEPEANNNSDSGSDSSGGAAPTFSLCGFGIITFLPLLITGLAVMRFGRGRGL